MLSPGGVQVLFDHAELVVEGGEELGSRREADRRVFATVMITIDLGRCADYFREPADEATARRVAELMAGDPQVHQQLHSMAARELARLAGCEPSALALAIETAMRVEGTAVLIDLDAMATLDSTRREGRG